MHNDWFNANVTRTPNNTNTNTNTNNNKMEIWKYNGVGRYNSGLRYAANLDLWYYLYRIFKYK